MLLFVASCPSLGKGCSLHLRNMELVVLVEDLADGINLEEFSATTVSYVAAEVGYLVFELDVAFLAQHADGGKEESLERFHPWVFSGALSHTDDNLEDGDLVDVFTSDGTYVVPSPIFFNASSRASTVFTWLRIKETNKLL